MEPEAKYTLVGATAVALLALLAGAVLWLVASSRAEDLQGYTIYFAKQSLEGLEVRSDVRMRGIRVGSVTGFSFASNRPGAVEVTIGISPKAPVRQSTQAVVDRNLITGLATIRLVNPNEASPPVARTDVGDPNPVIAEGASQLQQVSDTANQLAQRADETMRRISAVLSPENLASIRQSLDHVESLTRKSDAALDHLDHTIVAIGHTADTLRASTRTLADDAHRLAERFDGLGQQGTVSLRDASAAVSALSGDVDRIALHTETLLANSDLEIRLTARQLRAAAASLGSTARRFSDPQAAVFGPAPENLGPGEDRR